jgi:putative hydrolase of the HAD superfamily
MKPKGVLIDCGGTLLEEIFFDPQRGNEWLFAQAEYRPLNVTMDQVLDRAVMVTNKAAARREEFHIETPWSVQTRLIHEFFGLHFARSVEDLELGFWKESVGMRAFPGAFEALEELHRYDIPVGVVSNCIFGSHILQYELAKHGLAGNLRFVMVSAEYSVVKPSVLLFEIAAARLAREAEDIWFIGDRWDTDIIGARAAGMKPVWFQQKMARYGCISVEDWGGVLELFRCA